MDAATLNRIDALVEEAIADIKGLLAGKALLSIALGWDHARYAAILPEGVRVQFVMPNTPAMLGLGMILYATDKVSQTEEKAFLDGFAAAGLFDKIPEADIDAGSVVSGCGPAFAYAFIQALADGGVACGVDKDKALLYAAQTAKGAAEMLLKFGDSQTLIKNVCSPGGTTIEGVKTLESENLNGVVVDAVKASYKRTLELKK